MNCTVCQLQELTSSDFLASLRQNDRGKPHYPLTASLELTSACNLRCRHCYVDDRSRTSRQLTVKQIESVLMDLARHEVLFLVLTGGEPLLRPDFPEIYRTARRLGFLVILFTNATLVSPSLIRLFLKYPPRRIEVSVYGRTCETYESITGIRGSFECFQKGLDSLLAGGLSVELKTVVMNTNRHEVGAMRDWAKELGCHFRYDPLIHCSLAGSPTPIRERIPAADVLELQMSAPEDRRQFQDYAANVANLPSQNRLFECGAGTHIMHIDPHGQAHPCVTWRTHPYDLAKHPIQEGWLDHIQRLRTLPPPPGECASCKDRGLCGRCAPISLLETG
ncbi:MAG: radical SAM protein, partial [bacterium]